MEDQQQIGSQNGQNKVHTYFSTTPKISHHRHSGRKIHYHHTSYALLFFILTFVGTFLLFAGQRIVGAVDQVQSADVNLTGVYFGSPPTTAVVIESPLTGQTFTKNIITVSGTCQAGFIVEVMRNNALSGTIICSSGGLFSLDITLVPGQNNLVARTKNGANQYGPDSSTVGVTYKKDVSPTSGESGSNTSTSGSTSNAESGSRESKELPLILYVEAIQSGIEPEVSFDLKYEIDGGVPTYALSIDWSDGTNPDIKPHQKSGDFSQSHVYQKPGQYSVTLVVQDSRENQATIQTIVIVNGQPEAGFGSILRPFSQDCATQQLSSGNNVTCLLIKQINFVWPAFLIAIGLAISFWCGEKLILWRMARVVAK